MAAAHAAGVRLGMAVACVAGSGDNAPRRAGRLHVTVLGAPLLPGAVAVDRRPARASAAPTSTGSGGCPAGR